MPEIGDEVRPCTLACKRCNVGIELAAAPRFLALAEPPSGLNNTSAMDNCQVLRDLVLRYGSLSHQLTSTNLVMCLIKLAR